MKLVVDNQLIKLFKENKDLLKNSLLSDPNNSLELRWPSLLEFLGLGEIFLALPAFDQNQPLYKASIDVLCENGEQKVVYLYDSLFKETLNQIQNLPQIDASHFLHKIKEERNQLSHPQLLSLLSPALAAYEEAFEKRASLTLQDLVLYLSWDRMCMKLVHLFDHQLTNPNFLNGIQILKECLIGSYQHILEQNQTFPGIYRMLEAFFFYHMRDENLQKHTNEEWVVLSQSFGALKPQNELLDFFYVDDAVRLEEAVISPEENPEHYLTLDTPDRVNLRLSLANCLLNKLRNEEPRWRYILEPQNIVYIT